jgi:hypothetical protein
VVDNKTDFDRLKKFLVDNFSQRKMIMEVLFWPINQYIAILSKNKRFTKENIVKIPILAENEYSPVILVSVIGEIFLKSSRKSQKCHPRFQIWMNFLWVILLMWKVYFQSFTPVGLVVSPEKNNEFWFFFFFKMSEIEENQ